MEAGTTIHNNIINYARVEPKGQQGAFYQDQMIYNIFPLLCSQLDRRASIFLKWYIQQLQLTPEVIYGSPFLYNIYFLC